jgi:hypothetical protein
MSFGLRNAAQTFQRFMDEVLRGLEFCFANSLFTDMPSLFTAQSVSADGRCQQPLHRHAFIVHSTVCEKLHMVEDNPLTNVEAIKEAFRGKVSHLEPKEREMMLENYIDLFKDETGRLRCTNKSYHEIRTGDAVPIKKNVYKVPYALRDEMKQQLDNMVAKGVITPCASPWAARHFGTQKVRGRHPQVQILH